MSTPEQPTLRQQIDAYDNQQWLDEDCYYFYDWFCKDKALPLKAKSLMAKAKRVTKLMNVDLDKHYVWFKNNCPFNGPLYDDFRISDIETGEVVYNVSACDGHTGLARIYSKHTGFDKPMLEANSWGMLLTKLTTYSMARQMLNNSDIKVTIE